MVENPFADMGGEIFGKIFSSTIYFGIGLIFAVVLGIFIWYFGY
ncbi:unnamed protein product, partial [marine sediment metagenome]